MSFGRRLALVTAAAVSVVVLLVSAIVFVVVRGQLRGQVDDGLRELAAEATVGGLPLLAPATGTVAAHGFARGVAPLPPGVLPGLHPPRSAPRDRAHDRIELTLPTADFGAPVGVGQLISANGRVFGVGGASEALPASEAAREVAGGERAEYIADEEVGGEHVRVLTTQVRPGAALQVARSLEDVDATLRRLALVLLAVALGGVGLAAILGRAVARTAVSPVGRLTEAAEHVAQTRDLGRRIGDAGRDDELGRLADAFNEMLAELERAVSSQRQLVADASHELRTPLTSLRTNIEVLAGANGLASADRRQLLGDVVAQLDELSILVGNLVDLAREEEPSTPREDVRLDQLVAGAIERTQRHSRECSFEAELEPCVVNCVPERIERAVVNLLDNAAKWSPPGSPVEVTVGACEVRVRDHGPGIDNVDLPHVFDRFYRAADARGMPGSGLGLAIVRQVAEAHGGSAAAAAAEDGGAVLTLRLPPAGPQPGPAHSQPTLHRLSASS